MSRAHSALLSLPVLAIAAMGGGCGSSKEELSAAELVQKADRICRQEHAKFEQIQAHAPANASIAADQTKELIDASEAAGSVLRDLEPPESLSNPYELYLKARDSAVEQMKRGREAAESQDSAGYAAAQTAVAKSAPRRRELADAVGLKVCGSNPRAG